MNIQVALYFVSNVLATLIVGGKFATKSEKGFKTFAIFKWAYGFQFKPHGMVCRRNCN